MPVRARAGIAVVLSIVFASAAAAQTTTGNVGVVISEIAHGPSLPPVGTASMPSYIEIVNLEIANPVYPPPVPLAGMVVSVTVNGVSNAVVIPALIPATPPNPPTPLVTPQVGGNVQPPPAAQPPPPPPPPAPQPPAPVFLIAEHNFPAGVITDPEVQVFVAPQLFIGPFAQFAAAGVATEVCVFVPSINQGDQLVVPPATPGIVCTPFTSPFTLVGNLVNASGRVSRWMYVDSETDWDFDGSFAISPGEVNPAMSHVDGFLFGPPGATAPTAAGVAIPLGGTGGTVSASAAQVLGIKFHNQSPAYDRVITDPLFDRAIGAPTTITLTYTSSGASFPATPDFASNVNLAASTVVITAPPSMSGNPPGVLTMPNTASTLVDVFAEPDPAVPGQVRLGRLYTDGQADSGTNGTGDTSDAQRDTVPGSTGGGNTWCEVIIYDAAGNKYKGKAKNWPPPGTNSSRLSLGTTGAGFGDALLIDSDWDPLTPVYNVFSMTPASSCPAPLVVGLCPDALFTAMISPPFPLGTEPWHFVTDANGVYLWSVAAPAMAIFAGVTFEGVAVGFSGGILTVSSPASVTF